MASGYQPIHGHLDPDNPPQGGSGVPEFLRPRREAPMIHETRHTINWERRNSEREALLETVDHAYEQLLYRCAFLESRISLALRDIERSHPVHGLRKFLHILTGCTVCQVYGSLIATGVKAYGTPEEKKRQESYH
jgi:hypothetical protein